MSTLTDDDLERLLAGAAALAPPPEAGPPVLDAGAVAGAVAAGRRIPRWVPAAAAVAVALLVGRAVLDDPEPATTVASPPDAAVPDASSYEEDSGGDAGTAPGDLDRTGLAELDDAALSGAGSASGGGAASAATGGAAGQPAGDTARIVHVGGVEIEVSEGAFGRTVDTITSLATGLGGHVAATQTTELGDAPRGTVTLRVPADAFEQLLQEVRRLGEVRTVSTSGTDVTAQYTDLEARLSALTSARQQLLAVLQQARTIPDILAVQDRLNGNQVEIESLEGQRRLLEDRSGFGTLAVTVVEPGADEPEPPVVLDDDDGGLGGAWDEARRGFGDAVEWLVARSGKALVLAAVALVLYGAGLLALRRVRRSAI